MRFNRTQVLVALISAVAAVAVAVLQLRGGSKPTSAPANTTAASVLISGVVVSRSTNEAIPRAAVSVVGRTEQSVTETSGSFRLEIKDPSAQNTYRLRVSANGFRTVDQSVRAPIDDLVLALDPT